VLPGKKYTPEDLLEIAWRRKWLIVIPFVLIGTGTAVVAHFLPNRYRAETSMLVVPQRVSEAYVRSTVTSKMEDRLRTISQQILSRARLEQVIQDFNLYPDARRKTTMEDVVELMRTKDIELKPVRGDAFWVAYKSDEPHTAMKVVERLATMFIEENLKDREVMAEGTDQFLEAQLDDARRRLIEHEKKLEAYRGKYMGELPSQLASNLQVIQNTQMQLQSLAESLSRDRERRVSSERAMAELQAPPPSVVPTAAAPGELISLTGVGAPAQLEEARKVLVGMQARLKPAHPDILAVKRLITDLEKKAADSVSPAAAPASLTPEQAAQKTRVSQLQADLQSIDRDIAHKQAEEKRLLAVVAEYQRRAEGAPARESDLVELMRDYDTLQKIYSSLLAKKEDSKISANLERRQIGEQFKILDPARLPERPYSPNRARIDFIGALVGLAVGLGLCVLMEYRDSSFRSEQDILASLALPVLAVVPRVTTAAETRTRGRRRFVVGALAAAATVALAIAVVAWRFVLR
jgi:polysaccharide chain length determinant protein (PEP-CTERM system associated)